MLNVFEALKSEGLIIQDPTDPSGSTWVMSQDADKVVEKIEGLVKYAWKVGRTYELDQLLHGKLPKEKNYPENATSSQEVGVGGYNQAIQEVKDIVNEQKTKVFAETDSEIPMAWRVE